MATKTATKKTPAKKAPANKAAAPKLTAKQLEVKEAIEAASFLSAREKSRYVQYLAEGTLQSAPTLAQFDIKAHPRPLTTPCEPDASLYDAKKDKFLPIEPGELAMCDVLDTLAYACEKGKLNSRSWVKQVFHTEENLEWFLEELEGYDQCYRIYDRWWHALACLCEHENVEEGFVFCEDIVQRMREHIEETNQGF